MKNKVRMDLWNTMSGFYPTKNGVILNMFAAAFEFLQHEEGPLPLIITETFSADFFLTIAQFLRLGLECAELRFDTMLTFFPLTLCNANLHSARI